MAFTGLIDRDSWDDHASLAKHVASHLLRGRLALALGAGVSKAFGLPEWNELLQNLAEGLDVEGKQSNEMLAESIAHRRCGGDRKEFAELVRKELYRHADLSLSGLAEKPLLSAISSLAMKSVRGNVRNLINYNFDDLLARYLRQHGFSVEEVVRVPEWPSEADVRIYYPHGILPSIMEKEIPREVVFTASDFSKVVGSAENAWNREIRRVLEQHFVIFVGLSGEDQNLRSKLSRVCECHRALEDRYLFWGLRFGLKSDPNRDFWLGQKVYPYEVEDWKEVPRFLSSLPAEALELKQLPG